MSLKLTTAVQASLSQIDKLYDEIEKTKETINEIANNLLKTEETDDALDPIASEYRREYAKIALLNDDLTFMVFSLVGMVKGAEIEGIELGLTEDEDVRLEFLIENNAPRFALEGEKLVPIDDAMFLMVMEKIGDAKGFGKKLLSQLKEENVEQ